MNTEATDQNFTRNRKWAAYPAYEESDVEWLGEMPEHWKVIKLKHLCVKSALYGANVPAHDYTGSGVRFLRTTDISENGVLKEEGIFLDADFVGDYLLEDGDLLISRSGSIGRTFLYDSKSHGPCSYAGYLVRFVPSPQLISKYAFMFTKTQSFSGFLRCMAISSTIENVNGEKYANCLFPLPPLLEQTAIAAFLNRHTSRIDGLIEKKQRQIELLKEKRSALINHVVTKGLNLDVKMKDSSVEWLGEIPEHWEVRRLRNLAEIVFSGIDKGVNPKEQKVRFVGTDTVYGTSYIRSTTPLICVTASPSEIRRFKLIKGDVLITKDSVVPTRIAVPTLIQEDLSELTVCGYHLGMLRARVGVNSDYLFWTLRSSRYMDYFVSEACGTTIIGLSFAAVAKAPVLLPPLPEQVIIATFLDCKTTQIDKQINKITQSIDLLREYRNAIISAAVTGKIDVRDVPEAC